MSVENPITSQYKLLSCANIVIFDGLILISDKLTWNIYTTAVFCVSCGTFLYDAVCYGSIKVIKLDKTVKSLLN